MGEVPDVVGAQSREPRPPLPQRWHCQNSCQWRPRTATGRLGYAEWPPFYHLQNHWWSPNMHHSWPLDGTWEFRGSRGSDTLGFRTPNHVHLTVTFSKACFPLPRPKEPETANAPFSILVSAVLVVVMLVVTRKMVLIRPDKPNVRA